MNVEILTIGNELLSGKVVDTNSTFIAKELSLQGFSIVRLSTAGDTIQDIEQALKEAWNRANIIIMSGGLGPTIDDLTTDGICAFFHCTTKFDEDSYIAMEKRYKSLYKIMPECNKKQAFIPTLATVMPNTQGTAPGFYIQQDEHFVFVMPGVPHEMKAMFQLSVLPVLQQAYPLEKPIRKIFRTTNISESLLASSLDQLSWLPPQVQVSFLPEYQGVDIHLTYSNELKDIMDVNITKIKDITRPYCYSEKMESIEEVVARLLTEKNLTIACAESCSGGLLANRLTDISGSSAYLKESYVTYSNEAKIKLLGVSMTTIERYGAVSEECAKEMAYGVRKKSNSDIGIAITGIAGPTGATPLKPLGLVYIGYCDRNICTVEQKIFTENRLRHKLRTTQFALYKIWQQIK